MSKSKSSESSNLQYSLHNEPTFQQNLANLKPALDPRILSRLAQLQNQFEHVLNSLAKTFSRPKLAHIFLINNYDLVISVLTVSYIDVHKTLNYWFLSIFICFICLFERFIYCVGTWSC